MSLPEKNARKSSFNYIEVFDSMTVYGVWNQTDVSNNHSLTVQIASGYAQSHPDQKVLVIDLRKVAQSSFFLLGGKQNGNEVLTHLQNSDTRSKTIGAYFEERIISPYVNPKTGTQYMISVSEYNKFLPNNLHLIAGGTLSEIQANKILATTRSEHDNAWRYVHTWITELIGDIVWLWRDFAVKVFIDFDSDFLIYTELALSASDRLILSFFHQASLPKEITALFQLLYNFKSSSGNLLSEFTKKSTEYRIPVPVIYYCINNEFCLSTGSSAKAIRAEVANILWTAWLEKKNAFYLRNFIKSAPHVKSKFLKSFQFNIKNIVDIMPSHHPYYHQCVSQTERINPQDLDQQQSTFIDLVTQID